MEQKIRAKWLWLTPLFLHFQIMASELNDTVERWVIVNDTVMGGRSESNIRWEDDSESIRFSGELSLENNGGFASIRAIMPERYFNQAKRICIKVRGDGRTYQLRARTNKNLDGIAFVKEFKTSNGEWTSLEFSMDDFTPRFRGRLIRDAGKLKPENIRQIGFMLADKIPGQFQLDIQGVKPCRSESPLI